MPDWAARPVNGYLDRMRDQRELSPHTLEAYRRDLAQFFAYCGDEGVDSIGAVRRQHARRYLGFLSAQGYSKRSMTRKASAVRSFYNDAGRRNSATVNPFEGVSRPRLDRPLPHALPSRTVVHAIETIDPTTPEGLRDRALIDTLYSTGLRVSELASLSVDDVGGDMVTVVGKGRKTRRVPIGRPAQESVRRYLGQGRPELAGGSRRELAVGRAAWRTAGHPWHPIGGQKASRHLPPRPPTQLRHPSPRRRRRSARRSRSCSVTPTWPRPRSTLPSPVST